MMKKITLLLTVLIMAVGYSQQQTYTLDFEPGDPDGVAGNWITFDNSPPAAEIIDNPDPGEVNPTVTKVLKVVVGTGNAFYAGVNNVWEDGAFGTWMLDASVPSNLTLSMDINKNYVGTVGIKMGTNTGGTTFQIVDQNVGNAVVDQWQTLTWDLTGFPGGGDITNVDQVVVFVDWWNDENTMLANRADGSTILIDNITWGANKLTDPPVPSCSDGIMNQDETGIDCGGVCSPCVPYTSFSADFETTPATTSVAPDESGDVVGFDGATPTIEAIAVPQTTGNTSTNLLKLIRDGGQPWAGVYIDKASDFDFTTERYVSVKVWTDAPIGTPILLKTEEIGNGGNNNSGDKVVNTGVTGAWETLTFDFDGVGSTIHKRFVIIPNINALGNGTATSTYYFDDIVQAATLGVSNFDVTEFSLFPNPTRDSWTVKTKNQEMSSIQVFDILGKNVLSITPNSNEAKIDGSQLTRGLYFATITTAFGTSSKKLVKQ